MNQQMNSSFLPNLPDISNGKQKFYNFLQRTSSGPYSTKTVFFYKEGDHYFSVSIKNLNFN